MQPTEKVAESKGYQHQLSKGTINTEESTNKAGVSQPNREISFELTDGPTSIDDDLSTQDYNSSSEKEDSKKCKWKISTAENKKPIIESDVCLPCGDSTSAISAVKNPSSMGETAISEVQQGLQGKLETFTVADTTMTNQTNNDCFLHHSHNAGVTMDMEQRFEGDPNVHVVTKSVTRTSLTSSLHVIDEQQQLVPTNKSQTLPTPNSTTVEQQQIGDALKPTREELMKEKKALNYQKGLKYNFKSNLCHSRIMM